MAAVVERTKGWAVAFGCSAKISGPQDKVARKEDTHLFSHHSKAATHTLAPGEGLISFFSPAELKESQDEWRLPMPHPDGPRASHYKPPTTYFVSSSQNACRYC